jgi:hypothetical protein
VTDHVSPFDLQRVEDRHDVRNAVPDRVLVYRLWLIGLAEAAQVRRDDAEARLDERRHLVAPEARGVGEAVQQHDGRAFALVGDRQRDAIACDAPHRAELERQAR